MNKTPAEQKRQNPMEDYALRLRQIDSDIERLDYLHRVRVQYAALVDEQALKKPSEVSVVAVYDEGWSLRGLAFFVGLGVGARRVTQSQSGFMWVCKPDNLCV